MGKGDLFGYETGLSFQGAEEQGGTKEEVFVILLVHLEGSISICTDTVLSEEGIIRIYGKLWDIEVFFKACKSYLHLVKECRSWKVL